MRNQTQTSNDIRQRWLEYFQARQHKIVPSSSLIPHDPSLLLTAAGMVQFKPYMLGDEMPPYRRAASVQKCFRTTDIDKIGTTDRHFTFFEMLGNFSFGDYFKEEAISWAWELVTEVWGLDPERIWVTVFDSDKEAAQIWRESTGVASEQIVAMGREDNFWDMGAAGPSGPCSEIYWDRGSEFGGAGGPAVNDLRYVELWNLVFMQDLMDSEGNIVGELPQKNIDTGAGLDRVAMVLQNAKSVFETDLTRPLLDRAEAITGTRYGNSAERDVSLRVLVDHARAVTFLIADGVFPSNEDRGYVLRRVLRRAVRHSRLLGTERNVMSSLVEQVIETYGSAYPELVASKDFIVEVAGHEEEAFSRTLAAGMEILEREFEHVPPGGRISGDVAFRLHDTFGFPIDLTRELAVERGCSVDEDGFGREMTRQRERARQASRDSREKEGDASLGVLRTFLEENGPTRFTGYETTEGIGRILSVLKDAVPVETAVKGERVDVLTDVTPFYGEAGGQVGDTGEIKTRSGRVRVLDTTHPLPDLTVHHVEVTEGTLVSGQEAELIVDPDRRARIRRNHTATHLVHWALREVLGDHVKQAGSLVAPDRLRFDFNHFSAVTPSELRAVERLVNEKVMSNQVVRAFETSRDYADEIGAIAFFGDKYGDVVRVLEAGDFSKELCGGTHVSALGEIGLFRIVSEGSIGSNIRRIEALTGDAALDDLAAQDVTLQRISELFKCGSGEVPTKVEKLIANGKKTEKLLQEMQQRLALAVAKQLLGEGKLTRIGEKYAFIGRIDESVDLLRLVAIALRDENEVDLIVIGSVSNGKATLIAAVSRELQDEGISAADLIRDASKTLGGGGGKNVDLAIAGGPQIDRIDLALDEASREAHRALEQSVS